MRNTLPSIICVLALLLLSRGTFGLPPSFASSDAARQLVDALGRSGLDAIAAADPADPGTFVAALHIPGSQLLVVSARHPSVEGVAHRITMR